MTSPSELPPEPEPEPSEDLPLTIHDVVEIAESAHKGSDLIASVTAFMTASIKEGRISAEQALDMLSINKTDAIQKLRELHAQQIELAWKKAEATRSIGQKVLDAVLVLNPLRTKKED